MGTNPLAVIERYYADLNATDRQLADYVLANPMDVSRLPIDYLSEELGVSKSTLVRFAQKLGYAGFAALKQELARQLLSHLNSEQNELPHRPAERIVETYAIYLERMAQGLSVGQLHRLAELICNARRIVITGTDRAFHAARQLNQRLINTGVRSQAVGDYEVLRSTCNLYGAGDLLVVFTVADTMRDNASLARPFAEVSVDVVCITCTPALQFKGQCAEYVALPRISRDPDVTFLDDEAIFFVFIEVLVDGVAKELDARV